MCGIFGHTIQNCFDEGRSRNALHVLTHRGPDQWGDWNDRHAYLGHRRLSILDLSEHGKQPMMTADEAVVMTVNGEIYNHESLRNELKKKHQFTSNSDSEVILHGYVEWGIKELLDRIDGMFAFVIYDKTTKTIFLARDRVGIKPLYFAHLDNQFAWASELKSMQSFYGVRLDIDYTAFYDFLTYLYIPSPKTMYKDVFKLQPAHYLEIDLGTQTCRDHSYWELTTFPRSISFSEAKEELLPLMRKSVKEQMMSDVPVGFFLSGGIDSSAVLAMAAETSNDLEAFSIGFDDKDHDETEFASIVARSCGVNHHVRIVDKQTSSSLFEKRREWYDEPYGSSSVTPTYLVSEFARKEVTVVLTGDGGDELFGGYKWYSRFNLMRKLSSLPLGSLRHTVSRVKNAARSNLIGQAANKLEFLVLDELEGYAKLMGGMIKCEKEAYAELWDIPADYDDYWHLRAYYRNELPLFTRLQYLDFHTYLPDDILTKVDRPSMAASLEARVPLLSRELIEFSFSVPDKIRLKGGLKGLLKAALSDHLPQEILQREKKGFSLPASSWRQMLIDGPSYKQDLAAHILETLYQDVLRP